MSLYSRVWVNIKHMGKEKLVAAATAAAAAASTVAAAAVSAAAASLAKSHGLNHKSD